MFFLDNFTFFARLMIESNRFGRLAMMSDHELRARGTDRQRLVRGYLREIGAH
jgi:hypothetical protein